MGNALRAMRDEARNETARDAIIEALRARENDDSALVREHVLWALEAA
jgi:epoxyqueuosine reductase